MRRSMFEVVPLDTVPREDCLSMSRDGYPDVLVVDDERLIADTLSLILAKNGYEVITAYEGLGALALARAYPPSLLVTDVVMPGMTGIELALSLEEMIPEIKVLLFSGQAATRDLLDQAGSLGRNFTLLAKPVHPVDMLRHVAHHLKDSRTETASIALH